MMPAHIMSPARQVPGDDGPTRQEIPTQQAAVEESSPSHCGSRSLTQMTGAGSPACHFAAGVRRQPDNRASDRTGSVLAHRHGPPRAAPRSSSTPPAPIDDGEICSVAGEAAELSASNNREPPGIPRTTDLPAGHCPERMGSRAPCTSPGRQADSPRRTTARWPCVIGSRPNPSERLRWHSPVPHVVRRHVQGDPRSRCGRRRTGVPLTSSPSVMALLR